MKIDHNSYGTVALIYVLSGAAAFLLLRFVHLPLLTWPACALLLWFCIWQTSFFHVPERVGVGSEKNVSSVCDGLVVIAEKVTETEVLNRECFQISVYMNFFDVHANFWPVTGDVTYYKYHPGLHLLAFKPKASLENEHTCTIVKTPDGQEVFFKQIAGGFARRIVNYGGKKATHAVAGEQCGIIKFGSRIDIFLPLDADIKVKVGDYVRACESLIAVLK